MRTTEIDCDRCTGSIMRKSDDPNHDDFSFGNVEYMLANQTEGQTKEPLPRNLPETFHLCRQCIIAFIVFMTGKPHTKKED